MAFILVWEEHDTKLAYNRVEACVRERQGCGISGLKLDRLAWAKLLTRDFQHRRIEIGGDQIRLSWQQIAQTAGHNAGARGDFQNAHGSRRRGSRAISSAKSVKNTGPSP